MSLRDKMLAVMADVNADVAEREELVELIAIALLTRKNLFILGNPGQAKSYAVTSFCKRVTGARKFERLLSKQTDEEQLFGRLDLSSLLPNAVPESLLKDDGVYQNLRFDLQVMVNGLTAQKNTPEVFAALEKATQKLTAYRSAVAALHANEPVIQTTGKLPEADICFLDEIFKCNDGVLNSLLTALNERKYTNEGCTYSIPTISFFAASNEKLTDAQTKAQKELAGLLDRLQSSKERNLTLDSSVIEAANSLERKHRQVEAVEKLIDTSSAQHKAEIRAAVASASQAAAQKAEEVQSIFAAWSDEPGNLERNTVNLELLEAVRKSQTLQSVAKYLGRFREIIAQGRRNGYAFGRGESYALELGNNLSRALSSEFSMLASPQTAPLFLKKYQQKQLKQYRRRELIRKGMGDIICCLDESSSTRGDPAAWGKAVALALLDIAAGRGRKFALIHFASYDSCQVDVFLPGKYSAADKMAAAEVFLSGGTNFERPLQEAIRLMDEQEFENADIVFLTDGQCALSEEFASQLKAQQTARHFTVTGILLDTNYPDMEFSLHPFCQNVYRTSELLDDEIVRRIVCNRI